MLTSAWLGKLYVHIASKTDFLSYRCFLDNFFVMDWNSKATSEWDWEKLAGFSSKTIDIPELVQPSNHELEGGVDNTSVYSSGGGGGFSGSDLGHGSSSRSSISASADSSSKEGIKKSGTVDGFPKDFTEKNEWTRADNTGKFPSLGASISSGEPIIGLKLGKRTYFEDLCMASTTKTLPTSVTPTSSTVPGKRSRASYQSTQTPRCQVEGCNIDLKSSKDYHRRHRICESHSKSPKVIVAGMERRFCQQCSRQVFFGSNLRNIISMDLYFLSNFYY